MDVIIPVKNMADLLGECVIPIVSQLASDDRLVVVDDASSDATADVAKQLGAEVIRLRDSRGPYYARHVAAMQSEAEHLLFVDGRSRALPGLIDSHRQMLSRSGVALSCTETHTRSGPSFAEQMSAKRQPFQLTQYVGVAGRLDYFPTCNLGVRSDAYRNVGGFRHMRSGGDADLCWRVQESGNGALAADRRVLMEWVPRSSMRDLVEQWYRYGKSTRYLENIWPGQSMVSESQVKAGRRLLLARPSIDLLASAAFALGMWRGSRESVAPPEDY